MSDDYEPRCDVCDITCEEVLWNNDEWCGECGCCAEHCQQYENHHRDEMPEGCGKWSCRVCYPDEE